MSKLILNIGYYDVIALQSESEEFNKLFADVEEYFDRITTELTKKNSKYKIDGVEFRKQIYSDITSYKYSGLIESVNKNQDKIYEYAYVTVCPPILDSRNILGAQHIFPTLSNIVEKYISAPFYTLSNKPIYFVNGFIGNITNYMLGSIVSMHIMGVVYVDIFEERVDLGKYNDLTLYDFCEILSMENDLKNKIIFNDIFEYNYQKNEIKFITNSFSHLDSIGSSDRFFSIRAYAAVVLARKENIKIDVEDIETYLNKTGKGRSNFGPFIKYANKMKV